MWLVQLVILMKPRPVPGPLPALNVVSMRLLLCQIHSSDCGLYDMVSPVCLIHSFCCVQHEASPMSNIQPWLGSAWCSLSGVSIVFPVWGQHGVPCLGSAWCSLSGVSMMFHVCPLHSTGYDQFVVPCMPKTSPTAFAVIVLFFVYRDPQTKCVCFYFCLFVFRSDLFFWIVFRDFKKKLCDER